MTSVQAFAWLRRKDSAALLDIVSEIEMFHEVIDESREFLLKTFNGDLTGRNRQTNSKNVDEAYSRISDHSRIIVDKIGAFIKQYG